LGRLVEGIPFQAEGSVLFGMKNIGWLGAGYRSSNTETATSAISITAGVELNSRLLAAYTLDLGVEKNLNNSMGTQHEFMIAYRFGKDESKLEAELEKLRKRDQELQDDLIAKTDSLSAEAKVQKEDARKKQEALEKNIDDVKKEADDLRGKVLENADEIERLKKMLEERKVKHKHIGEVFFDNNSDKLSDEIKTHLNTMKSMLANYPKGITIYLYGNASVEGDAKRNMELSVRRGSAVRQYLLQQGINAEKVYVIPMGEYNPLDADPKKQEKKDRRIDIMVSQED
jgi:outer membrane protein OmpA-like peptidoglycan-associated protein